MISSETLPGDYRLREEQPFIDEDFTGNVVFRGDGGIATCNPAFARIFGFGSVDNAMSANL